jgi:tetratricopeptide (TPR) repeat protein
VLAPVVTIDGADAAYEREASLLLWVACIEVLQRHPRLAVLDPEATPLVPSAGHLVPANAGRGARADDAFFVSARRDELVWLEVGIRPDRACLHVRARDGRRAAFEGSGRRVGEQIHHALGSWLGARALGGLPRPFESCSADELLGLVRLMAPVLVDEARAWPESMTAADDAIDDDDSLPSDLTVELAPMLAPASERTHRPAARALASRLPITLRVPAIRLLELGLRQRLTDMILAVDADHPHALLASDRRSIEVATVRRALANAPGWSRPYELLCRDGGVDAAAAAGMVLLCRPDSLDAAMTAGRSLADAGRPDDAVRAVVRAAERYPDAPRATVAMLDAHQRAARLGPWLASTRRAMRRHGCSPDPSLPRYDDQIRVDLRASVALFHAGRLAEATAVRADRLTGRDEDWPAEARTLARWHEEPSFAAWCEARAAWLRGDHARVLAALTVAPPSDELDVAMLLDALVAVGREADAPFAWAVHGLAADRDGPVVRLSAARALMAAGEWRRGIELLWRAELVDTSRDDHFAIARCGLVMSAAPIEVIDAALGERIAIGAPSLARRLARIAADFVPAAAKSTLVARALGTATAVAFDASWLDGFAPTCSGRAAIDALFARLGPLRDGPPSGFDIADELQRGDALVGQWLDVVLAAATDGDRGSIAEAAAYTAAQALARYLAATTWPPTTVTGALRTVAAAALALLRVHRDAVVDRDAGAVLRALDPVLRRVDRWIAATWLAAVERALALDERSAGDVERFARDLPVVAARLLGPEDTAVLAWSVATLQRERPTGWPARLAAQASRLAWHTGGGGADAWADAIAAQLVAGELDVDDAVDAMHVACYFAEGRSAGPCVHAARVLLDAGRAPAALAVLTSGLQVADPVTRDSALAALADGRRARLDVPLELEQALAAALDALVHDDPGSAEKLARFAVAVRPSEAEAHRVLGLALARQGNAVDALHHLTRAVRDAAPRVVAEGLARGGYADQAAAVLGYAAGSRGQEPPRDASWRARRFELQAACRGPRALALAATMLAETTGTLDRDGLLARALALEIREQAFFAHDPWPRDGADASASTSARPRAIAGALRVDREVAPETKISRVADYVALLRDLAALAPGEALAAFDLDDNDYVAVAQAWAIAMQADPALAPAIEATLATPK